MNPMKVQPKVAGEVMSIFDALKHLSGESGREVWDYQFHGGLEEISNKKWGIVMMGSIKLVKVGAPKLDDNFKGSMWDYMAQYVEVFRIDASLEPSWVGKAFHLQER